MPRDKLLRVTEDTFAALVRAYVASPKFRGYSTGTQDAWGRELRHASLPDTLGAKLIQAMRPSLVQAYLDGMDGRPGKQAMARAAIVQLEKWAIVRDLLPRPITTGVETESPKGGHKPWSDQEVRLAELHMRPDLSCVVTLAVCTGQRRSDLVRLGPTDLEAYKGMAGINVIQKKTGKEVWVPITPHLAESMETWERRAGPFLLRRDGRPWRPKDLTMAFTNEIDGNPALAPLEERGLVLHGLRGTACVRLRQAGANAMQIADMVGMSVPMVERYCRFSVQKENAAAAVINLARTLSERSVDMSSKMA